MTELEHYAIKLSLNKEFMIWVHDHPANAIMKGSTASLWDKQPDIIEHSFGGKHGVQFNTIEETASFLKAFKELLRKKHIAEEHMHPLFYIFTFFKEDVEKQSIKNNRHNELLSYVKFILDLFENCKRHFQAISSNPKYQPIFDQTTNEMFFAKKELYESMPLEELVEHIPDEKNADDVVRYLRVIWDHFDLYIPDDLLIEIHSERTLKSFLGEKIDFIAFPKQFRSELYNYIIKYMLEQHKKDNTILFQMLLKSNISIEDLKVAYTRFSRYIISNSVSLKAIGVVVNDYLEKHKLIKSQRQKAYFLFEYFALFKAYTPKDNPVPPSDYSELPSFYRQHDITQEKIRLMMKDVGEI